MRHQSPNLLLGVSPSREFVPRSLQKLEYRFFGSVGLVFLQPVFFELAAHVAKRWFPRPDSVMQSLTHSLHAAHRADIVIEFSKARENGFEKLTLRVRFN